VELTEIRAWRARVRLDWGHIRGPLAPMSCLFRLDHGALLLQRSKEVAQEEDQVPSMQADESQDFRGAGDEQPAEGLRHELDHAQACDLQQQAGFLEDEEDHGTLKRMWGGCAKWRG
jgi:hypothetical protein